MKKIRLKLIAMFLYTVSLVKGERYVRKCRETRVLLFFI